MSPPIPWSIIALAAARETRNEPLAITSCCRSQSLLGGLEQRLGDRQAGVVDDEVDPAERQSRGVDRGLHGVGVGDVGHDRDRPVRAADPRGHLLRALGVQVGDHDARALGAEPLGDRLADARAGAGDQGHPSGERLRRRHPLQLGLLERPVLDPELLALVDRGVGGDRLGAAHHVDGVDVELAGHARGLLVLAEREHPDAGDQHDRRVRTAHRRAVRGRVPVVVGGVLLAVRRVQLAQARDHVARGRPSRGGRPRADGPSSAGSGRGTTCPAAPAAAASRARGSRARRRCR